MFKLGWEEWLALPELGVPALKVKVDTGARTSALHASRIRLAGPKSAPEVHFLVQPVPERPEIVISCKAPLIDKRLVTSSNGESEMRFVIETVFSIGGRQWRSEVTLTNRDSMAYRMLLGRSAIGDDMVVSPGSSYLQEKLDYDVYGTPTLAAKAGRPLRIALLTREPDNYSSDRLRAAAIKRGHSVDMINTTRCYIVMGDSVPEVHYDGKVLPRYDAVIPRIGASKTGYGTAVLRQFANTGSFCLNSAAAIAASRDKLLAHQILSGAGIGMPLTAFANSPQDNKDLINLVGGSPLVVKLLSSTHGRGVVLAETRKAAESLVDAFRGLDASFLVQEYIAEAKGADVRCFVIGGRVVAAMRRQAAPGEFRSNLHAGAVATKVQVDKQTRAIAVKATRLLGLSVAGVDILESATGPKVLEVNSSPGLEGIEKATGRDLAGRIIAHIESKLPPQ